MKHTFTVLFYLKRKECKTEKQLPIIMRITVNGNQSVVNTKLKCYPSLWSPKSYMTGDSADAIFINETLFSIKKRIEQIYYQLVFCGETITSEIIKEIYTGIAHDKRHLISSFTLHNENIRKQVGISRSNASYQKYEAARKHLESFLKSERQLDDIPLNKINHDFINEFEIYLRTAAKCNHNTTAKFIQSFKRIIILAINNKYIKDNPFLEYKIRLKQVDRLILTMDELRLIIHKQLPYKRLEVVRDLFIFCCFTGLAYVDLKKLERSHIYMVNGNPWIRFNRNKTNETTNLKLFDLPFQLIEKYKDPSSNFVFPVLSNQKMNLYLKEIMSECGIDKKITFHTARHTCATTIALANGMPMESVSKMLGHKNIRTTQIYAKITDHKLNQDMILLQQRLTENGI